MDCIFCGREGRASREHVFPQWLGALFQAEGDVDYIRRVVSRDDEDEHTWTGSPLQFVVKDVCEDCNTGWMHRLEEQARPILTPLITDEPRRLSAVDQYIIAVWATKTMLTGQGLNLGGERFISSEMYHWFFEHQAPLPNAHIWVGRYRGEGQWPVSVHAHGITLRPQGEPEPAPGDALNGHNVVMTVGHLVLWLWGHELPGGPQTQAGSDARCLLIWPTSGSDIWWPPSESFRSDEELEELSRRHPGGTAPKLRASGENPPMPGTS